MKAPTLAVLLLLSGGASAGDLKPFTSDGCSLFPDRSVTDRRDWCACCLAHDLAYWRGGTAAERRRADDALGNCVRQVTGDARLARSMRDAVRIGGHPVLPTWFRWGYGWSVPRGYRALTRAERTRADELEAAFHARPATYCPVRRTP